MNEEMINRAQREVDARRQRALVSADERREAARAAVPQLRELEMAQSSAGIRAASLAASGAPEEQTRAALAEMHALRQQICDALLAVGIRPESLEPQFVCPRCRDTGRVGGKQCECVSQLIRTYRREEITRRAPLALCSFDSFDVSLYPDRFVAELGMTVREHMTSIFEYCKAYADHFSRTSLAAGKPRRFISERSKILPRRTTGTCAMHQRQLTEAIKRARQIALLPFVTD